MNAVIECYDCLATAPADAPEWTVIPDSLFLPAGVDKHFCPDCSRDRERNAHAD